MGIATHQMAGFDQAKAREAFAIPEVYAIGSVMAMGYQGELSILESTIRARNSRPAAVNP